MKPSIIYLFVSPSGRAYAGKHEAWPDADRWPRRGSGPLPDGYRGSGKLWANVTKKYGPAIRWIILRRFQPGTARARVDNAERRAVRLARAIWADRCMNVREGGQGFTSAEAQASVVAAWADPDVRSRNLTHLKAMFSDADVRARHKEARKAAANKPEARAAQSSFMKGHAATPEGRAQLESAWAKAKSPEARAKHRLTKSINNSWRRLAQRHPEWWTLPPSSGP